MPLLLRRSAQFKAFLNLGGREIVSGGYETDASPPPTPPAPAPDGACEDITEEKLKYCWAQQFPRLELFWRCLGAGCVTMRKAE